MEKKLDLELLYTLTVVAETGSLKRTSERIYRSHSAVSMQIKRLEEAAGGRIISRRRTRVELTERGRKLLTFAREMLRLNSLALAAMEDEEVEGRLSIGLPIDYTKDFIKDVLPEVRGRMPNLHLNIVCESSRALRRMVESGNLDVAIVAGEKGISDDEFLWSEKLHWVSSADFVYDSRGRLPIAMFEYNCIIKNMTLNSLKNSGVAYEQVLGTPVLDNIAEAVQGGIAVSLLPESVFRKFSYRILPEEIIKNQEELLVNLITNKRVDPNIIRILVENIRRVFSLA